MKTKIISKLLVLSAVLPLHFVHAATFEWWTTTGTAAWSNTNN